MHDAGGPGWRRLVAVFWVTSMIEGLGMSQVFALLPAYLHQMGVSDADRASFVGLFGSVYFIVGLPLVPLWGVWADKYSRKAVIARSAVVEGLVFIGLSLARAPWQIALSLALIGFQLGNTGVMLAGIRDVVPKKRIGTIIGIFGVSSPVGFASGPVLAGILIDGAGWSISSVFFLSSVLSLVMAGVIAFGTREVRPEVVPEGRVIPLAFGAMKGVLADPVVRGIFVIFGASFLANQMMRPYLPLLVEKTVGLGPGLASAIGIVSGAASLAGALLAPATGWVGDRIGFRRVLLVALAAGAIAVGAMPWAGAAFGVPGLAVLAVFLAACSATVSAMVFGLLATEVPAARRSQTLNLVYLPLYGAGVIGPLIGSGVSRLGGVPGPFYVAALGFALGMVLVARHRSRAVRDADTLGIVEEAPALTSEA
jgi:DHA1 family multidrug resistance protein-like MFS transporter